MDDLQRKKILKIYDGVPAVMPWLHALSSSRFGVAYIDFLYRNKIFGNTFLTFYQELGSNLVDMKRYILKAKQISYKPIDLVD